MSLPSIETAQQELKIAAQRNPGPWVMHSIHVGIAARNIAAKIPEMNPDKAYILGVLHDIGRRVGVVTIPVHVYEGYQYAKSKNWEEVAKICMTHSYPLKEKEFTNNSDDEMEQTIKHYIEQCQYDDYDRLIQLCDSIATEYGFCIMEKRFVDVVRRYGFFENTIDRWNEKFAIKQYFDEKIGGNIYDVLPDIGRTTLFNPSTWKPPVQP